MATTTADSKAAVDAHVRDLLARICLMLDDNKFVEWLDLCTPDFQYTISAWSPEIRRDMVWLDHDAEGLRGLMQMLPKHNSDQTPLTRHLSLYTVDVDATGREAQAVSSVVIFATALDGGASELWAVGRYHDTIALEGDAPRLRRRVVKLQTRSLGIGKHWPV